MLTESIVTHDNRLTGLRSGNAYQGRFHFITTYFISISTCRSYDSQSQSVLGNGAAEIVRVTDKKISSENKCHKCYQESCPEVLMECRKWVQVKGT